MVKLNGEVEDEKHVVGWGAWKTVSNVGVAERTWGIKVVMLGERQEALQREKRGKGEVKDRSHTAE
jgi:hypothetical protein